MHVALAIALLLSATGPVPTANQKASKVRCDITVIHATKGKAGVDPALKPLASYLTNSFGSRYQSFKEIGRTALTLAPNERAVHKLPNDTELSLTYLGADETLLRLLMEVSGLKTTVKVHDGGLFFQAGRSYKEGMLVVAIRSFAVP